MDEPNNESSAPETLLILLYAAGLAVIITIVTFSILDAYGPLVVIVSLALNLVAAYTALVTIIIMGESFIEDVVKAALFSAVLMPALFLDYKYIEFIKCLSLGLVSGAWYAVVLRFAPGLGESGADEPEIENEIARAEKEQLIEKALRRRKRKEKKRTPPP